MHALRYQLVLAILLVSCVACTPAKPPVVIHDASSPPQLLSEWGVVFADGERFELNDHVIPYDLNTPLFSDYARKLRTIWLPAGTQAEYREKGPMEFPVGTIISKTFYYQTAVAASRPDDQGARMMMLYEPDPTLPGNANIALDNDRLIETRLLIRYDDGWKAWPYVWNDEQTDATLEIAGDIKALPYMTGSNTTGTFNYVVPDANQCSGCHAIDHSTKAIQPIGPRAWQLNRDFDYGEVTENQIDRWQSANVLRHVPETIPQGVRWLVSENATTEDFAKAYLDVNCAHCHNSVGAADTSGLDLDLDNPVGRSYGICKPPVAVGRGSGDRPFDIYPGRPEESILLYRMEHSDPAIAMPELGRTLVHVEGVQLVRKWIESLDGDC